MKKGKYSNGRARKPVALILALVLVLGIAIGGTIAWLTAQTPAVVNEFDPAEVTTRIDEDITKTVGVKQNVRIQNTGDIDAYIRAAVVITWKDSQGNICGELPTVDTDYTITYNTAVQEAYGDGQWVLGPDNFYYWTKPVKSVAQDADNCYTGVLITECKQLKTNGEYTLNVEILGSGIQSVPANVVTTEWASGVQSVSDTGALTIKQQGGGAG